MAAQSEKLLEALVDLERAKQHERESRFESEALLEGLRAITTASSAEAMFASLLGVFRDAIGFDNAFILQADSNGGSTFRVVATTDPIFNWTAWKQGAMFRRIVTGPPVALFDISRVPEWMEQPMAVKACVKSALHAAFHQSSALFVCTSKTPGFFSKKHIHLLQRFSPLASQAMISLAARELSVKQEILERSRLRLTNIIATVPIGLLLFRGDEILTTNPAFHRLVGQVGSNTSLRHVLAKSGLPNKLVAAILAGSPFTNSECVVGASSKDARLRNLSLSAVQVYGDGNHRHGYSEERLLVVEDISERKATEETLRYTAFQAGVAETATSILHNIGNAITGICNRARRLHDDANGLLDAASLLDHIQHELLSPQAGSISQLAGIVGEASRSLRAVVTEDIQANADVIGEGVKHIAEIITIQQGAASLERNATAFCLRRLLEDAVTMHADTLQKYGIDVDIDLDPQLTQVVLPRNQLLQTLVNLIKNSREAIQARMDQIDDKRITLSARLSADNLFLLRVIDNGCGMGPEQLPYLFCYGYSTKQGGHGYGLHWVANFVQSLSGRITAHSSGSGKGMDIRIELPIHITSSQGLPMQEAL